MTPGRPKSSADYYAGIHRSAEENRPDYLAEGRRKASLPRDSNRTRASHSPHALHSGITGRRALTGGDDSTHWSAITCDVGNAKGRLGILFATQTSLSGARSLSIGTFP
jgi:hypothetical protein